MNVNIVKFEVFIIINKNTLPLLQLTGTSLSQLSIETQSDSLLINTHITQK
jgi:hypothetical protein